MSEAGSDGVEPDAHRVIVRAFALAAVGVVVGGLAAIVADSQGASTLVSLSLMSAIVLCGAVAGGVVLRRAGRGERPQDPGALLERQLSVRYGVPVQRLAWHVWCIDGELVEATLDTSTGYLTSGGRELPL